jgi:hypothetical protein
MRQEFDSIRPKTSVYSPTMPAYTQFFWLLSCFEVQLEKMDGD